MKVNEIYNENCLDTMAKMPDNFIDLIITSPPYDNLRNYNGYSFDFESIAKDLFRITKVGGVVVWIVSDSTVKGNESGTSFRQALYFKEIGFNLYDTMIYEKPCRGAIGSNKSYYQSFEYMFVLSKGLPKTINLICDRENKDSRTGDTSTRRLRNGSLESVKRNGYGKTGRRINIWKYMIGNGHTTKDKIAFQHPAIFPDKLAADHIESWSNEGDLVYDPFAGSGTVGKMCITKKRNYILSEISEQYIQIIKERIAVEPNLSSSNRVKVKEIKIQENVVPEQKQRRLNIKYSKHPLFNFKEDAIINQDKTEKGCF